MPGRKSDLASLAQPLKPASMDDKPIPAYSPRDILYPLDKPWDEPSHISIIMDSGELRYCRFSNGDLSFLDGPPDLSTVWVKPAHGTEAAGQLLRVENIVLRAISTHGGEMSLEALLGRIEALDITQEHAETLLRVLVARGDLTVKIRGKNASKPRFRLSDSSNRREGMRTYTSTFAHELTTQSEQVGRLIGHAPTRGSQREELLRNLIERHVPTRYHVATGFVEGANEQVDILIYDQVDYAPLFRAGNLVVVPIEAVRAVIEVKSMLNSDELEDALSHLEAAVGIQDDGPPIFRGVFAYQGLKADTLIKAFKHHHREATDREMGGQAVFSIYDMATAICVLRRTALFPGFRASDCTDGSRRSPAIFELSSEAGRENEAALFFDFLLRHLRYPFAGSMTQGSFSKRFAIDVHQNGNGHPIYAGSDWGPYTIDGGIERVEAQIAAYDRWLTGGNWVEPAVEDDTFPEYLR